MSAGESSFLLFSCRKCRHSILCAVHIVCMVMGRERDIFFVYVFHLVTRFFFASYFQGNCGWMVLSNACAP